MPGNLTEESRVCKHQEGAVEIDIEKFRHVVTVTIFAECFDFQDVVVFATKMFNGCFDKTTQGFFYVSGWLPSPFHLLFFFFCLLKPKIVNHYRPRVSTRASPGRRTHTLRFNSFLCLDRKCTLRVGLTIPKIFHKSQSPP